MSENRGEESDCGPEGERSNADGLPTPLASLTAGTLDEDLLIRSKHDLDRADRLIKMGYPRVAPYIPNMLEWIQDMNWPVAMKLAPFLASLGQAVVPEIRKVLDGHDMVWKYWCIGLIGEMDTQSFESFRAELERLATDPTDSERLEELNEQAIDVLRSRPGDGSRA